MGSYDRDYMRDDWRGSGSKGTWAGVEPIVWIFMGISVAMFLLPNLTGTVGTATSGAVAMSLLMCSAEPSMALAYLANSRTIPI